MTDRLLFSKLSLAFLLFSGGLLIILSFFGLFSVRKQFNEQWEQLFTKTQIATRKHLSSTQTKLQERASYFIDQDSTIKNTAPLPFDPLVQFLNKRGIASAISFHPAELPGGDSSFSHYWVQAKLFGESSGFEWCPGARICVVHYSTLENAGNFEMVRAAQVLGDDFLQNLKTSTGDEFAMAYEGNLLHKTFQESFPMIKTFIKKYQGSPGSFSWTGDSFKARSFALDIPGRGGPSILMIHNTTGENAALKRLLYQSLALTVIMMFFSALLFFYILRQTANTLAARAASLAEKGRLAAVGELASGIAHEVNNPLTAIRGYTQLLQKRSQASPQTDEIFNEILHETDHIHRIVRTLLGIARPQGNSSEGHCLVEEAVADTLAMSAMHGCHKQREVKSELQPDLRTSMSRSQLVQVLLNLVVNALQATPEGGTVLVKSSKAGGIIKVEVIDQGTGIPRQHLDRLFDPFFTTKAPGEGTGLGLSVSHRLITEAGGRIQVDSAPGRGSVFTLHLPGA